MIGWREHVDLLRGLLTGDRAFIGPFFVSIDLTRRCNLSCLHCRYHSCSSEFPSPVPVGTMDLEPGILPGLLRELRACGTRDLIFAGEGEPLLYPQFESAVAAVKAAGFHLNVITNGTLLTDETIDVLIDQKLDILTVSLWASSPDEYQRLYPGTSPAQFNRVLAGLRRVSAAKARRRSRLPRLRLHRPISRQNFQGIEEAFRQARDCGCNHLTVAPVHSLKGDAESSKLEPEEEAWLCRTLRAMQPALRRASMHDNFPMAFDLYRLGEAVWKTTACYVGWVHSRVRVDGTVFTCGRCDIPMGSLHDQAFRDIWNGHAYRQFRRTVSTRAGLASMGGSCLCGYCCHLRNSLKIDRVYRWISPVAARLRWTGARGAGPKSGEASGRVDA